MYKIDPDNPTVLTPCCDLCEAEVGSYPGGGKAMPRPCCICRKSVCDGCSKYLPAGKILDFPEALYVCKRCDDECRRQRIAMYVGGCEGKVIALLNEWRAGK